MSVAKRLETESKRLLNEQGRKNNLTILVNTLVPVSLCILVSIPLALYLVYRYRSKYLLSKRDVQEFFKGSGSPSETVNGIEMDTSGKAQSQPYDKERFEVDKKSFSIGMYGLIKIAKMQKKKFARL